jgi:hypothetical protein
MEMRTAQFGNVEVGFAEVGSVEVGATGVCQNIWVLLLPCIPRGYALPEQYHVCLISHHTAPLLIIVDLL